MSNTGYLVNAQTRHTLFVQRYAGGVIRDLLPVFAKLRRDIAAVLATLPEGDFRIMQSQAVLAEIDGITRAAMAQAGSQLTTEMVAFGEYEAGYTSRLLGRAGTASFVTPPTEAIAAAVTREPARIIMGSVIRELTIPQLASVFSESAAQSIRTTIAAGYVEGKSSRAIAAEVSRLVDTRTRAQAEAMVRTATNHMASVARTETYRANSDIIEGERVVATLDARTTLECASNDGNVYPIGEGPMPPLHYNCRSTRVAVLKPEYRERGLDGDRPAEGGAVGERLTYDGWLRRQSDEFQNEAIGPERAAIFREGVPISRFTDDESRVLTLTELREREGLTL